MNNLNSKTLKYPIFLIEKRGRKHAKFGVVRSRLGYSTISRVPIKNQYIDGFIFDSSGIMYSYSGDCGKPRFDGWIKVLLELLIIPPILTKLLELIVYFGPRLSSASQLSIEMFKEQILENLSVYEDEDELGVLKRRMRGEGDYSEIIEAVDWFIWKGKRSEDYQ